MYPISLEVIVGMDNERYSFLVSILPTGETIANDDHSLSVAIIPT